MTLNESIVEDAALQWFEELSYAVGHGPQIAPGEPAAERESFGGVVLVRRLRNAIRLLNPSIPEEARALGLGNDGRIIMISITIMSTSTMSNAMTSTTMMITTTATAR